MLRTRLAAPVALAIWACKGEVPRSHGTAAVPQARLADPAARERGRALFASHCVLCHGERGDGRGERRAGLSSPPRDFTDPAWQSRTSALQIFSSVRQGVPGTAMPSWAALSEEDCWDLVAYVRSLAIR